MLTQRLARGSDPGLRPPLTFAAPGGVPVAMSAPKGWTGLPVSPKGWASLRSHIFPAYNYNDVLSRFKARRRVSDSPPICQPPAVSADRLTHYQSGINKGG